MRRVVAMLVLTAWSAPSSAERRAVELHQGPVLGAATTIGAGGAVIGRAEGSGAQFANPAAVANRDPHNGLRWYAWDWTLNAMDIGLLGKDAPDFDNDGERASAANTLHVVMPSLALAFGRLGLGVAIHAHEFRLCLDPTTSQCPVEETFIYTSIVNSASVAYALRDGELIVGAQVSTPVATFVLAGVETALPMETASSLGVGALWRPPGVQWRLGAVVRSGASSRLALDDGDEVIANRVMPERIIVPWEVGLGAAYNFGRRPINLPLMFGAPGEAASDVKNYPRDDSILTLDVVLVGPSQDAIGLESWLAQEDERAGKRATVSIRAGYEHELRADRFRGRLGSYFEPSRFEEGRGRLHLTTGCDVRIFKLVWDWQVTAAIDVAERYSNITAALGFWR
jgi:hypothetical protein